VALAWPIRDGVDLFGDHFDDDPPSVGGIRHASHVPGLLQPVDDAGHGTRGQAHHLGQAAGGRLARVDEDLESLDIGLGEPEPQCHRLAEERALEVHAPQ